MLGKYSSFFRCIRRKGDQFYLDILNKVKQMKLYELDCHVASSIENCKAFQEYKIDLRRNFTKAEMETDDERGFANYADNQK
jgi:hypothetical protein